MRAACLPCAFLVGCALIAAATGRAAAADPQPDFSGVWTNASITHLTRLRGQTKLVLSEAEAGAIAAADPMSLGKAADHRRTDPNAGPPPVGGDTTRGFNAFWTDSGDRLGRVQGEYRTSWIVDPADGQLPLSPEGRRRVAEANAFAQRADTPTDPETLEPWDRCLIGSRGSGGPGMLNNLYNSNVQIVQTQGSVAIVIEMIHEVRTVPIFPDQASARKAHGPASLQPWLGDSVGWWEGATLVVETTNVNPEQGRAGPIFLTPQGKVSERFSRPAQGEILYEFAVDDPVYYARPWSAEMTLVANPGRLYEYACHEGNYAMTNVLRATRLSEAKTAASPPSTRSAGSRTP